MSVFPCTSTGKQLLQERTNGSIHSKCEGQNTNKKCKVREAEVVHYLEQEKRSRWWWAPMECTHER